MKLVAPVLLVVIGLLQMIGDLTGVVAVKGIGAATGASPAPKVFSSVRGLETFGSKFLIGYCTSSESCTLGEGSVELTPEIYARLGGPYNRRNVYGAALAYAPVLPAELRDPVIRHALCGDAPLLRELGIAIAHSAAAVPTIEVVPGPGSSFEGRLGFRADCR